MSQSPDQDYALRAATAPVAPVTLWLFPSLAKLSGSSQRPALRAGWRQAQSHWTSRGLWALWGVLILTQVWFYSTGQESSLRALRNTAAVVLLAWLGNSFVRVQGYLKALSTRGPTQLPSNTSLERTRER